MKVAGDSTPETFGICFGLGVETFVFFETLDVSLLAELLRRLEDTLLGKYGINIRARHAVVLRIKKLLVLNRKLTQRLTVTQRC
jgi:hypothetical protein